MDEAEANASKATRGAGLVLILAACASIVLLALHPDENAANFAGVLKNEASGRAVSALVHGGMTVVLAVELAALAILVARVAAAQSMAIAGFVFFAMGVAFLSASLLTDGLVIPAIAAKYAPVPAKQEIARALFVLCSTFIRFLMPLGLAFLAAGIAMFGTASLRASPLLGLCGLVLGGALLLAVAATAATLNPLVVMGGFLVIAIWMLANGISVVRGRI